MAQLRKKRKFEKEERRRESAPELSNLEVRFYQEKFQPISSLERRPDSEASTLAKRDPRMISRNTNDSLEIFMKVVPFEVWQHIAEQTNLEMKRRQVRGEISAKTAPQELPASKCSWNFQSLFLTSLFRIKKWEQIPWWSIPGFTCNNEHLAIEKNPLLCYNLKYQFELWNTLSHVEE